MNNTEARAVLDKIVNHTASANETIDFIESIVSHQLLHTDLFGHFDLVKIDDSNPYADDENEILGQVAIQEDGPEAYMGESFSSHTHTELQCSSPVDDIAYSHCTRLRKALLKLADALDTVELDPSSREVKFSEEGSSASIFGKDMSF